MRVIIILILSTISASSIFPQNCQNTSRGYPPINDLGIGLWRGVYQGGLYQGGSNNRPAAHNNGGLFMASQVRPLDTAGNYDPVNGKIVWLSVGMSNTTMETQVFIPMTDTFRNKNPKLILVDGAQGGQDINIILDSAANFWRVITERLAQRSLTTKQVQAIWFKEAEIGPHDTSFPNYALSLKNKFKTVMRILKNKYPNVKLCYLSSRIYAGYATTNLNPEPYAYYSGWSVKWLVEDQVNGDTNLTYTGSNPKSPWLSWGAYPWADGIIPRSDGLTWICPNDYNPDGVHPSLNGRRKVANLLFQFFTVDETTIPWFLNNPSGLIQESGIPSLFRLYQNYPNPFNSSTLIRFDIPELAAGDPKMILVSLKIYDALGREVTNVLNKDVSSGSHSISWDASGLPSGVYIYRFTAQRVNSWSIDFSQSLKMILLK